MAKADKILSKQLEMARRDHHEAKVRANTKVYEGKAVIGGTIVGCITRLEAIRWEETFSFIDRRGSHVAAGSSGRLGL
jgi:hypothetical protein